MKDKPIIQLASLQVPFNEDQVDTINAYQRSGLFQPLTCPDHPKLILEASVAGLSCSHCSYLRKQCPEFIASGRWRTFIQQTT